MCGIVGYIGDKQAYPILIKGLSRLEYRGYDSAGVALIQNGQILNVYKRQGKVQDLVDYAAEFQLKEPLESDTPDGRLMVSQMTPMLILISVETEILC